MKSKPLDREEILSKVFSVRSGLIDAVNSVSAVVVAEGDTARVARGFRQGLSRLATVYPQLYELFALYYTSLSVKQQTEFDNTTKTPGRPDDFIAGLMTAMDMYSTMHNNRLITGAGARYVVAGKLVSLLEALLMEMKTTQFELHEAAQKEAQEDAAHGPN